ncbi:hypothetical protein RND71_019421 [Anisodus tanguticus]|uniref:Uncharacterized protein n=1 Tax=Anisodus tanguticus TaxID=243964 RepID=A0AAE1S059_9SOLA|nr:hypothetical protein RND71_019421 [Anisodus tanguticus]
MGPFSFSAASMPKMAKAQSVRLLCVCCLNGIRKTFNVSSLTPYSFHRRTHPTPKMRLGNTRLIVRKERYQLSSKPPWDNSQYLFLSK